MLYIPGKALHQVRNLGNTVSPPLERGPCDAWRSTSQFTTSMFPRLALPREFWVLSASLFCAFGQVSLAANIVGRGNLKTFLAEVGWGTADQHPEEYAELHRTIYAPQDGMPFDTSVDSDLGDMEWKTFKGQHKWFDAAAAAGPLWSGALDFKNDQGFLDNYGDGEDGDDDDSDNGNGHEQEEYRDTTEETNRFGRHLYEVGEDVWVSDGEKWVEAVIVELGDQPTVRLVESGEIVVVESWDWIDPVVEVGTLK